MNVQHTPQTALWVRDRAGTWAKQGVSTTKSVLANLSPGFMGLGAACAAGLYLKAARWSDANGWQLVVDDEGGDVARVDRRAIACTTAWGSLHAVMNDGSVLFLDAAGHWQQKSGADGQFQKISWPLVAFDAGRQLLVAWGPEKAKGGRKDETFVFDGKAWTKVKKPGDKAADAGDTTVFNLFCDPSRGGVVRLGPKELAVFDGVAWKAQPLTGDVGALDTWRRLAFAHPGKGASLVINIGQKSIARIDGARVSVVARFEPPMPRPDHDNQPFDRVWFDDHDASKLRLMVHGDTNDRDNYALDLVPLFG